MGSIHDTGSERWRSGRRSQARAISDHEDAKVFAQRRLMDGVRGQRR